MRDLSISGWRRTLLRLLLKVRSWIVLTPGLEVELFRARSLEWRGSGNRKVAAVRRNAASRAILKSRKIGPSNRSVYVLKITQDKSRAPISDGTKPGKPQKKEGRRLLETVVIENKLPRDAPCRFDINGGSKTVSVFSKQGLKGVNQDTMLVLEDFAGQADTIFCGVFDGHGAHGHLVARIVRDYLPEKLAASWRENSLRDKDVILDEPVSFEDIAGSPQLITAWKESFVKAYKLMDKELLMHREVDYVSSGTTAVTLVKQGNHLFLGNVGDSRAVLGVLTDNNSLMALQLTVDLKPNLPKEAERIKRFRGRIFALRTEPSVKRVWLPHADVPGLAMARSLGDFCLKKFGIISEPLITYRHLSQKDKFIVLASDGVWDVLSNEQVIEIVASVPVRSLAAKAVVEVAAFLWRLRQPNPYVDDCTAVCIFLDDPVLAVSSDSADVGTASIPVQCELIISGNDAAANADGVELIMVSDVDCNRVEVLTVSCSTKNSSGLENAVKNESLHM